MHQSHEPDRMLRQTLDAAYLANSQVQQLSTSLFQLTTRLPSLTPAHILAQPIQTSCRDNVEVSCFNANSTHVAGEHMFDSHAARQETT